MVEIFEFQALTGSVVHIKLKFTITTRRSRARLDGWYGLAVARDYWYELLVQDLLGDRRVHSVLSEVVVCSELMMVCHCIITHKITARSIARVNQLVWNSCRYTTCEEGR